jgi:lipopolysaccharide/colanic/teichoic acid biosynthesis glycosyltransferase
MSRVAFAFASDAAPASQRSVNTSQHGESSSQAIRPETETISAAFVRMLDIIVASIAIVVLAPLLLGTALMIALSRSGPVLFRQSRIGRDGVLFTCLKFRTMHRDSDAMLAELLANCPQARAEWAEDQKLRHDPRVSAFGRFIRRASIDELPQLWNVLTGDMSIVGPRPIVASEAPRYGRYIRHYQATRPGITGVWQVNGRNDTSYRRRIACDVVYSRSVSIATNLRIIFCTVPVVLKARGAY